MERIEILENKIKAAVKTIQQLQEKNVQIAEQYKKLVQENDFLHSENQQVRKLMVELDRLKEEKKMVRQKCERLLTQYQKMNL